jgi:hypothetical protein
MTTDLYMVADQSLGSYSLSLIIQERWQPSLEWDQPLFLNESSYSNVLIITYIKENKGLDSNHESVQNKKWTGCFFNLITSICLPVGGERLKNHRPKPGTYALVKNIFFSYIWNFTSHIQIFSSVTSETSRLTGLPVSQVCRILCHSTAGLIELCYWDAISFL